MIIQMKRRLFIAVPIPEHAKREISYALDRVNDEVFSCGKLVSENDWHITLKFLGEQDEEFVEAISSAMKNLKQSFLTYPMEVVFTGVSFNPSVPPRMIWVNGSRETSEFFGEMKDVLDKELAKEGIQSGNDFGKFTAHATLARFFKNPPRGIAVNEPINIAFRIESLNLMDSKLQRGGPIYTKLDSITI